MGGQKAKKKPVKEQEMITYSQFTQKPPAKLRENNIPIKKGKLVGDVQIAWASYSEDEKGKISTVWHVLKIDKKFAEEHLSGVKPGVIENAMKAAAEGKSIEEIENILIKGIVEVPKPKPLPYTGKTEKGVPYLIIKVPKKEVKPIPTSKTMAEVKKMTEKYWKEKAPTPKKPPEPIKTSETAAKVAKAKKPKEPKETPPVVKPKEPGKKEKPVSDIDDVLAKIGKGKEQKAPESGLGGIAGPGESHVADIGKGAKSGGPATGKVKVAGAKEKAVVSNIEFIEPKKTTSGSVNTANKTLESTDATFTTVGATEKKDYNEVVNFYYNKLGKKPGGAALQRYGTITFEAANGEKYKFFIFITTSDFERAGVEDLSNMSKKEREKAINKMTDDIFSNMVKWLGSSKLPKSDQPAIKDGIKNMITKIVDSIVEERSQAIELSG